MKNTIRLKVKTNKQTLGIFHAQNYILDSKVVHSV